MWKRVQKKVADTHTKYTKPGVPYVALPRLRDANLGDKQETTPTDKEAHRRALHLNGTLRDALVALALAVVVEDSVDLLSQLLHVLDDTRHPVWLVSGTKPYTLTLTFFKDNYFLMCTVSS